MSELKLYNYRGEKVALTKDIADYFAVAPSMVDNCIGRREGSILGTLTEGEDYYYLIWKDLARFKRENGLQHKKYGRLKVITERGIRKLHDRPEMLFGRAKNVTYVGNRYFNQLGQTIPVYEMRAEL